MFCFVKNSYSYSIAIALAYDLWANAVLLGRDLLGKSTLFFLTPKVTFSCQKVTSLDPTVTFWDQQVTF